MLRETTGPIAGVDALAIHHHVELAGLARPNGNVDALLALDRSRETRGSRLVVSDHAVENLNSHQSLAT